MKTVATVMQLTRGLLILTPAEYDKPEGGLSINKKRSGGMPTNFSVPQIFELNDSLKERPFEKSDELAAFVKRCAESVSMELGDIFLCIEDEDILITKEYKHAVSKDKLLLTYARVEAESVLHQDVDKYTILNFEYGQQYGKANKSEDVSASLFAMNTGMLTDIRSNFSQAGLKIVKITPPIAGMLYTSKADFNSATRAIAVISMDFAATRLVVLHNGAPVFQQSFSSVLEDIAELFMLEFGISKLGAIDLIRQEGLGVCNKCNSASTRKQTMTMLDNAAGEILRNLRMVISTLRLDIDQIVLCDALAKLPNISAYCRQVGLTAPMENVMNLFSGGSQPPTATQAAVQKGFDPVSFITLNGVLTMPMGEANLLQGESNILSAMAKEGSSKLGNLVAGILGVAAAVWIIGVTGWWIVLEVQKNGDASSLENPEFKKAQTLIDDEKTWSNKTKNLDADLMTLPQTEYKSSVIVKHVFDEVIRKSEGFNEFKITNTQVVTTVKKPAANANNSNDSNNSNASNASNNNKAAANTTTVQYSSSTKLSFNTESYKKFNELRNEVISAGFFSVAEGLSSDRVDETASTTSKTYYKNSITLELTDKAKEEAALKEEERQAREALSTKNKAEANDNKANDNKASDNKASDNKASDNKANNTPAANVVEIPTDAAKDEKVVGTWEYSQDGLTMSFEFKSDGTGTGTALGSPTPIKWGTKDGVIYISGSSSTGNGGTASVQGEGKYSVDGNTLTMEMSGQSMKFNKK